MNTKQRYRLAGFNGGQPVWLTKSELAEINKNYNEVNQWPLNFYFIVKNVLDILLVKKKMPNVLNVVIEWKQIRC